MRHKAHNLRKAALLIASLDEVHVDALMRQMSLQQADRLRQAIAELGEINPREQNDVIEEFFRISPLIPDRHPTGIALDGPLPRHLSLSPPGEAGAGSPGANDISFKFLQEASTRDLAPFLERENPQTIAVVVSRLPAERAAEILAGLPAELQIEVARRLVDMEETDVEILREIERGLEAWLGQREHGERRRPGVAALNQILDAASPQARQHILANLNRHEVPLGSRLGAGTRPAASFADLERWDSASLSVVLHHVDRQLLVLALAGASVEFAGRALDLLPSPTAEAVRKSLAELGPTRLSDVEEAMHEIALLACQLEQRGEIAPEVRGSLSVAV